MSIITSALRGKNDSVVKYLADKETNLSVKEDVI